MLELNKGDKVIVKGFTGIKLGVFEVASATKKTLTVLKKNGDEMIFDRKTGKQINVEEGKEKYANSIIEDDGSFKAPARKKPAPKKAAAKAKPEPEDDEDEDEDDEPAPPKKTSKTSPKKTVKKRPVVEDDDDDDDFEEVD